MQAMWLHAVDWVIDCILEQMKDLFIIYFALSVRQHKHCNTQIHLTQYTTWSNKDHMKDCYKSYTCTTLNTMYLEHIWIF